MTHYLIGKFNGEQHIVVDDMAFKNQDVAQRIANGLIEQEREEPSGIMVEGQPFVSDWFVLPIGN